MSILDDDLVDQFDIWDSILNFIKDFMKVRYRYYFLPDINEFNFKIYPPHNQNNKGVFVYYNKDNENKEVEIYFHKKGHNSRKNLSILTYVDKKDRYRTKEMSYDRLIQLYNEHTR